MVILVGTAGAAGLFLFVSFLAGQPVEGIIVSIAGIASSQAMIVGRRVASVRYGRPGTAQPTAAMSTYRQTIAIPAVLVWALLGIASATAVLSLLLLGFFSITFPDTPELVAVMGLMSPAMGMTIAGTVILAATVRDRQPLSTALLVTAVLAPLCLAAGYYSARLHPGEMLQPGWTQMCTLGTIAAVALALVMRRYTSTSEA